MCIRDRAYTKAIQWGIMNRDEARELENRNRIPDGLGQVFLTPLNMAPLTDETITGEPAQDSDQPQQPKQDEQGDTTGAAQ